MTKHEWEQTLINDPRYDADWIDKVSELLSTYDSNMLEEMGIKDLDDLSDLDARFIHIFISLAKIYATIHNSTINLELEQWMEDVYDNQENLIRVFIESTLNKNIAINATQGQLIASMIDYYCKIDPTDPKSRALADTIISSDDLAELINGNIPYTALNFIAKGIIEGYGDIWKYSENEPAYVASMYAIYADGIYDKLKNIIEAHTDNRNIFDLDLTVKRLNLLRYLVATNMEFTVDSDLTIHVS